MRPDRGKADLLARAEERLRSTILYNEWKDRILLASDGEQVVSIVREYLGTWTPEQLRFLPPALRGAAMFNAEDIVSRATVAMREEINADGLGEDYFYLREMALTLAAAAARLRFVKVIDTRELWPAR